MKYIDLINSFWRFYDENRDKISPSDIVLYKVLLRYCNKIGWVNPFTINPFLMNEINPLSQNTYYKSFKRLHDLKLIEWNKGRYNVSNQSVTILKINTSLNNSLNNSIDNSLKFSLSSNNKTIIQLNYNTIKLLKKADYEELLKSNEFNSFLENENLQIIKKEQKPILPKDKPITLELFDIFWKLYPSSKGKGNAKKSWEKLCKLSLKEKPAWKIIKKAIILQTKSEQWQDTQYIPHGSTWLNNYRWLDDADEMKAWKTGKQSANNLGTRNQTKNKVDYSHLKSKIHK